MDAQAWDARYRDADLVWSKGPNLFVEAEVAGLPPGRALDLAGGEGRNAIWLARRGWDVELVDFSAVALDKARRLADHAEVALTTTRADLVAAAQGDGLQFAGGDLVLVIYLQLPRDELRPVLSGAAHLVRSGGTLLVVSHARRNLTHGVGGPPDPEVLTEPDEVVADLVGTGLVIGRAHEVLRPVETDDGPRDAIDVLVRAHRPG